jgi:hypothetical protein
MFTSLERIDQRVPTDLSPQLLRKAHDHLDAGNDHAAAIVLREAVHCYLLAAVEFYGIDFKPGRRVTNGRLIHALVKAERLGRFHSELLTDILGTCNAICHCQPTRVKVRHAVEIAYWAIFDACPWRKLDPRHDAKPKKKDPGFDDEYDPANWWKGGDA